MDGLKEKLVGLLSQVQYLGGLEEKIADHLIFNGVVVQRWIPVDERLPTSADGNWMGRVLGLAVDGAVSSWPFFAIEQNLDYFTHWMPIPKVPGKDVGA